MTRYFLITCHRGHCGNGHSTAITFAIAAENLIEASDRAKRMPSVKHTRGIIAGKEISKEEYDDYKQISAYQRSYSMSAKFTRRQ